jgi:hypothetical protein
MSLLFVLLAGLLVPVLTVIHDFANGRPILSRDLDEIHPRFSGHFQGLRRRHDSKLLASGPN